MGGWIRTVRFRLSMLFIAIVVLASVLTSSLTLIVVNRVLLAEVKTHIHSNLVTADGIYESVRRGIADSLRLAALDDTFTAAGAEQEISGIASHIETIAREADLDVLWWVDTAGRVVYRAGQPGVAGDEATGISVIARAANSRTPLTGNILLPAAALVHERPAVQAGDANRPATAPASTEQLAIAAAVPVTNRHGQPQGVLFGARLMNQRYEIVDRIRDTVFAPYRDSASDPEARVTIFQGATRVATTPDPGNEHRAIGTAMSEEVRQAVLQRGAVWTERAFVIDRWFLTAVEPIRDPDGAVIGALGLGLPEDTLLRPQRFIMRIFMAVVGATTLMSLLLIFGVTQSVLQPITSISAMLAKVAAGDLSARVAVRSKGEIGALVEAVNGMADALAKRQEQLEQAMRRQLGHSEKMASIGRLAAGVAHEVNNPLTGVLTFASLLKKRPVLEQQDRDDLDVILRETTRVRDIVKGLLEFAREAPSTKQPLDLNEVVRRTLALLKSQKEFSKIIVDENLAANLARMNGDQNQIQQVLLNLLLNACEAMPAGGGLTITTSQTSHQVVVAIADTGCGIKPEHLDRIFEPFFTTKPVGKGTGLGLSVSYGIVQQHSGAIEVDSSEGTGTTFTVFFPAITPPSGG